MSGERGIDAPKVGDRFPIGGVEITVTAVSPQPRLGDPDRPDGDWRTIVTGVDDNGEDVEVRFVSERDWQDDV